MNETKKTGSTVSGAMAWSEQVSMSQEEIDEFLSGRWLCRLATLRKDGSPYNAPAWYYWDGVCLFLMLTSNRLTCKNLLNDPRCAAIIDMDDRPLMGMRKNLAKAVHIAGKATVITRESGEKIQFEGGPWKGLQAFDECRLTMLGRYGFWERDGVLGLSTDKLRELVFDEDDIKGSQLEKDHVQRVIVKIRPDRVQAWDFSKAPFGRHDGD